MADIGAMDDTIRDPSSYARRMILDGLPPLAQSRYRQFVERKMEAEAALRYLRERDEALGQRLNLAARNLLAAKQSREVAPSEERAVATLEAEYDEHTRRRAKANERRTRYDHIIAALDNWLISRMTAVNTGPDYTASVDPPVAVLGKNESYVEAIQRTQQQASSLRMEFQRIKVAPLPASETRALIRAELERRHAEAMGLIGSRWDHDAMGVERFHLSAPDLPPWASELHPAGLAMGWALVMFGTDAVFEKYVAVTKLDNEVPGSVPRAEKPRLLADLEARIIDAELEEMSLVEQAQAEGLDVLPRASMSALALLGLAPARMDQPFAEAAE